MKHLHMIIFTSDSPVTLTQEVNTWFHDNASLKIMQYAMLQNSPYTFYVVYEHQD